MTAERPGFGLAALKRLEFRTHLLVFAAVAGIGFFCNLAFGAGLPIFWPLAVWSVGLAVHFFVHSCRNVDEDWVDYKAEELRMRSYDFDHIRDIRARIDDEDPTVVHHAERGETEFNRANRKRDETET